MSRRRGAIYAALVLLFALHNDWWLWADRSLWGGLPAGLAYHLLYTFITVVAMVLLLRYAWPDELDGDGSATG